MKIAALIILSLVGFFVLTSEVTYAAAAECYRQAPASDTGNPHQDGGPRPVHHASCGRAFRQAAAEEFNREPANALLPNHCYVLRNGSITEGTGGVCAYISATAIAGVAAAPHRSPGFSIDNPDRSANINCTGRRQCLENNSIVQLLKVAIKFFTIIIGVLITAVIIWAGFTYAHAGGDANDTAEAKNRIKNAIIALACFIFIGVFLNWAVPGSLF